MALRAAAQADNADRYSCGLPKPDVAIASCGRIINDPSEPADIRALTPRNRGFSYQSKGDHSRAIIDYTAVLKLSRKDTSLGAKTYLDRGLAYAGQGDEARALLDYGQALALALDPTLASAYVNRAAIYLRRGDKALAITDLS